MSRRLAIGDIHGCYHTLVNLIEMVDLQPDDELIFLGDYCDRGPNTKQVIDELIHLSNIYKCTFLRGNHEQMFLDFIKCDDVLERQMFLQNGGWDTLASYSNPDGDDVEYAKMKFGGASVYFPQAHYEFIKNTVGMLVDDEFVFVHAGLTPTISLDAQWPDYPDGYLWIRQNWEEYLNNDWNGRTVVYGHTVKMMPRMLADRICLDTGCVFNGDYGTGGYLTCCDVNNRDVWMTRKAKGDFPKVKVKCDG